MWAVPGLGDLPSRTGSAEPRRGSGERRWADHLLRPLVRQTDLFGNLTLMRLLQQIRLPSHVGSVLVVREPSDHKGWAGDHPVLELLRERRAKASSPGSRDEGCKLGLAVEGGGMRGIVSAAMLSALEDLGLAKAFDAIYAASSGAINAAYFLVGETWYPLSIYYDDLTTRKFLDFRRPLRRRAMLDLDYAFDVVVDHFKPLDYDAVLASPIPLHVAVTFVDTLTAEVVSRFESKEDLKAALRASGWLPLATDGTATFRGRPAVDGGALVAHPFRFAVDDGCTHVLSLSTRPMAPPRQRLTLLQRYAALRMNRLRRGLGTAYVRGVHAYGKERAALARARTAPSPGSCILDLAPLPGTPEIKRHEMDRGRLLEGARGAYEVIVLAIEKKHVRVIPRLTIPEHEHAQLPAGTGPFGQRI
jgi:predicted patatin/cPLA2 family phospholipase